MKNKKFIKFEDSDIAEIFSGYPKDVRESLLHLRSLIFESASETEGVGKIQEVLKWGQPSYITPETRSGSTIRIDRNKTEGEYAIFFHCQTDLVSSFRRKFPKRFAFEGNRSILFRTKDRIPEKEIKECISDALTYHLRKKNSKTKS